MRTRACALHSSTGVFELHLSTRACALHLRFDVHGDTHSPYLEYILNVFLTRFEYQAPNSFGAGWPM